MNLEEDESTNELFWMYMVEMTPQYSIVIRMFPRYAETDPQAVFPFGPYSKNGYYYYALYFVPNHNLDRKTLDYEFNDELNDRLEKSLETDSNDVFPRTASTPEPPPGQLLRRAKQSYLIAAFENLDFLLGKSPYSFLWSVNHSIYIYLDSVAPGDFGLCASLVEAVMGPRCRIGIDPKTGRRPMVAILCEWMDRHLQKLDLYVAPEHEVIPIETLVLGYTPTYASSYFPPPTLRFHLPRHGHVTNLVVGDRVKVYADYPVTYKTVMGLFEANDLTIRNINTGIFALSTTETLTQRAFYPKYHLPWAIEYFASNTPPEFIPVKHVRFTSCNFGSARNDFMEMEYPRVEHLIFQACILPRSMDLASTFPNLKTLRLHKAGRPSNICLIRSFPRSLERMEIFHSSVVLDEGRAEEENTLDNVILLVESGNVFIGDQVERLNKRALVTAKSNVRPFTGGFNMSIVISHRSQTNETSEVRVFLETPNIRKIAKDYILGQKQEWRPTNGMSVPNVPGPWKGWVWMNQKEPLPFPLLL